MTIYRLLRDAERDLVEIGNFAAERWGETRSRDYLLEIRSALDRLSANPMLGSRRDRLPPTMLAYPAASHRIYYRIAAGGRVEVIAILHPAMDTVRRIRARR